MTKISELGGTLLHAAIAQGKVTRMAVSPLYAEQLVYNRIVNETFFHTNATHVRILHALNLTRVEVDGALARLECDGVIYMTDTGANEAYKPKSQGASELAARGNSLGMSLLEWIEMWYIDERWTGATETETTPLDGEDDDTD